MHASLTGVGMKRPALRALSGLALALAMIVPGCLSSPASQAQEAGDDGDWVPNATAAAVGQWQEPFDGGVPAVNLVLLNNGRLLYWSGVEHNPNDGHSDFTFFTSAPVNATSRVLDLSGDEPLVLVPEDPHGAGADLFCSGQTILADGRVLAIGSSLWNSMPTTDPFLFGGADARTYDPETNSWVRLADMHFGRWYPTLLKQADGTPTAFSGITSLSRFDTQVREVEHFDEAAGNWTVQDGAEKLLPLYPRVSVVAGGPLEGKVFYNTVGTLWGPFGEHPEQPTWSVQKAFDVASGTWEDLNPSVFGARQHANSVMQMLEPERDYAPEFVTFGGTLQQTTVAVPFTEVADLAVNPPANRQVGDLEHARWHANGILLPTGEILAVGGGLYDNVVVHGQPDIPIMEPEIYDPASESWRTLAPMQVPRMYHSTAVLLPDARVLVAGHVPLPNPFKAARDTYNPQVNETRMEIFEPPYLFRGPRPTVDAAPAAVAYGETFEVEATLPAGLDSVVLFHPGSTTHAYDMAQRGVELVVLAQQDGLITVQAPPNSVVAPPGHYMLFVNGEHVEGPVPSVAAWVELA